MKIDISGHHVEVTDAIREAITQKLEKVQSHYPQLESAKVIFTVERNDQVAEVTTQFMGTTIAVEAHHQDLYVAIAEVVKKLDAKLGHKKGAMKANRHQKFEAPAQQEDL